MTLPETCEEHCKLQTKLLIAIAMALGVNVEEL